MPLRRVDGGSSGPGILKILNPEPSTGSPAWRPGPVSFATSGNVSGTGGVATSTVSFGSIMTLNGTDNTFEGPVMIGLNMTGGNSSIITVKSLADIAMANGRIVFASLVTYNTVASIFANTGTNTYTGTTTVDAGNLQIDAAATLPSGSTISLPKTGVTTGTLRLNAPGTHVYNNLFTNFNSSNGSGNGGIPNILNVQGDNTFSGIMTIAGAGGNGVNLQCDAGTLRISGNLTNTVSASLRPFSFGGAGNAVFSGVMSDTGTGTCGMVKPGTGNLAVGGTNSSFTGGVFVMDGVLNVSSTADTGVNSSIGAGGPINLTGQGTSGTFQYTGSAAVTTNHVLNVAPTGGTIDASGTGSGTLKLTGTVAAGASLAPSAPSGPGTLAVVGGLDLTSPFDGGAGKLRFDLGPIAESDRIVVAGTLTLDTGKLGFGDFVFSPLTGLANGTYKLITAGTVNGSLDPTAANLTGPIGIGGTVTLQITGNDLELVLTGLSGLTGYNVWASTNAPGTNPAEDQDGDGVSNAVEYVPGGTITTNDQSKLPVLSTSGGNMLFTSNRAQASIDGSTVVTIEVGTTLTTSPAPGPYAVPNGAVTSNPGVSVIKNAPAAGFDTITLTLPHAPDPRKFARLKVVVTP